MLVIRRQPASGHNAMNMRMRLEILAPGMQNTEEPNVGAQVFGVNRHLQQRRRTGFEEEFEENVLVLPHERDQGVRNGENQVVVVNRQQLLLTSC